MIKLSVVIITFNEEKNLERCLHSVKDIADEIVVVDSFSTDRTREIAQAFGVKFIQHAFNGHIEQKNYAITQASSPYILSLDADEALDKTLTEEIKRAKQNWDADGYSMNRLTNYCGHWVKHCGWYPDTKLRLWDSRLGKWGGMNPHDKYEIHKPEKGIKKLQGDILHFSYYTLNDHYKQMEYFADISALAMDKAGKRWGWRFIYLAPVIKFIQGYFFKLGFLDGSTGFSICRISAYGTWLKYYKLKELQSKRP